MLRYGECLLNKNEVGSKPLPEWQCVELKNPDLFDQLPHDLKTIQEKFKGGATAIKSIQDAAQHPAKYRIDVLLSLAHSAQLLDQLKHAQLFYEAALKKEPDNLLIQAKYYALQFKIELQKNPDDDNEKSKLIDKLNTVVKKTEANIPGLFSRVFRGAKYNVEELHAAGAVAYAMKEDRYAGVVVYSYKTNHFEPQLPKAFDYLMRASTALLSKDEYEDEYIAKGELLFDLANVRMHQWEGYDYESIKEYKTRALFEARKTYEQAAKAATGIKALFYRLCEARALVQLEKYDKALEIFNEIIPFLPYQLNLFEERAFILAQNRYNYSAIRNYGISDAITGKKQKEKYCRALYHQKNHKKEYKRPGFDDKTLGEIHYCLAFSDPDKGVSAEDWKLQHLSNIPQASEYYIDAQLHLSVELLVNKKIEPDNLDKRYNLIVEKLSTLTKLYIEGNKEKIDTNRQIKMIMQNYAGTAFRWAHLISKDELNLDKITWLAEDIFIDDLKSLTPKDAAFAEAQYYLHNYYYAEYVKTQKSGTNPVYNEVELKQRKQFLFQTFFHLQLARTAEHNYAQSMSLLEWATLLKLPAELITLKDIDRVIYAGEKPLYIIEISAKELQKAPNNVVLIDKITKKEIARFEVTDSRVEFIALEKDVHLDIKDKLDLFNKNFIITNPLAHTAIEADVSALSIHVNAKTLGLDHKTTLHAKEKITVKTNSLRDMRGAFVAEQSITIQAVDSIFMHGKAGIVAPALVINTKNMMVTDKASIKASGLINASGRIIFDKTAQINAALDLQIHAEQIDNYADLQAAQLKFNCKGTFINHQSGKLNAKYLLEILSHHFFSAGSFSADSAQGLVDIRLNGICSLGIIPDSHGYFGLPTNWQDLAARATSVSGHTVRVVSPAFFAFAEGIEVNTFSVCTLLNVQILNIILRINSHITSVIDFSFNADIPNPVAYYHSVKNLFSKIYQFLNGEQDESKAKETLTLENFLTALQGFKWIVSKFVPGVTKPLDIAIGVLSLMRNAGHTYDHLQALYQKENREIRDWLPLLETMFGVINQTQMLATQVAAIHKNGRPELSFDTSYFERLAQVGQHLGKGQLTAYDGRFFMDEVCSLIGGFDSREALLSVRGGAAIAGNITGLYGIKVDAGSVSFATTMSETAGYYWQTAASQVQANNLFIRTPTTIKVEGTLNVAGGELQARNIQHGAHTTVAEGGLLALSATHSYQDLPSSEMHGAGHASVTAPTAVLQGPKDIAGLHLTIDDLPVLDVVHRRGIYSQINPTKMLDVRSTQSFTINEEIKRAGMSLILGGKDITVDKNVTADDQLGIFASGKVVIHGALVDAKHTYVTGDKGVTNIGGTVHGSIFAKVSAPHGKVENLCAISDGQGQFGPIKIYKPGVISGGRGYGNVGLVVQAKEVINQGSHFLATTNIVYDVEGNVTSTTLTNPYIADQGERSSGIFNHQTTSWIRLDVQRQDPVVSSIEGEVIFLMGNGEFLSKGTKFITKHGVHIYNPKNKVMLWDVKTTSIEHKSKSNCFGADYTNYFSTQELSDATVLVQTEEGTSSIHTYELDSVGTQIYIPKGKLEIDAYRVKLNDRVLTETHVISSTGFTWITPHFSDPTIGRITSLAGSSNIPESVLNTLSTASEMLTTATKLSSAIRMGSLGAALFDRYALSLGLEWAQTDISMSSQTRSGSIVAKELDIKAHEVEIGTAVKVEDKAHIKAAEVKINGVRLESSFSMERSSVVLSSSLGSLTPAISVSHASASGSTRFYHVTDVSVGGKFIIEGLDGGKARVILNDASITGTLEGNYELEPHTHPVESTYSSSGFSVSSSGNIGYQFSDGHHHMNLDVPLGLYKSALGILLPKQPPQVAPIIRKEKKEQERYTISTKKASSKKSTSKSKTPKVSAPKTSPIGITAEKVGYILRSSPMVLAKYEILYRGDGRDSSKIFKSKKGGFRAVGTNTDVLNHVKTQHNSAYVSTTASKNVAETFPRSCSIDKACLYEIHTTRDSIYIPEIVEESSLPRFIKDTYKAEEERAFKGIIKTSEIKGAWPVEIKGSSRTVLWDNYIYNPYFISPNVHAHLWQAGKVMGLSLMGVGAAFDGYSLYQAYQQSELTSDYNNTYREASRITGAWIAATRAGTTFAQAGVEICAPFTAVVAAGCGIVGGLLGGAIGYYGGGEAATKIYDVQRSKSSSTFFRPKPETPKQVEEYFHSEDFAMFSKYL